MALTCENVQIWIHSRGQEVIENPLNQNQILPLEFEGSQNANLMNSIIPIHIKLGIRSATKAEILVFVSREEYMKITVPFVECQLVFGDNNEVAHSQNLVFGYPLKGNYFQSFAALADNQLQSPFLVAQFALENPFPLLHQCSIIAQEGENEHYSIKFILKFNFTAQ